MKKSTLICLTISAIGLSATASAQDLIQNGDFTANVGLFGSGGWSQIANGNVPGWSGASGGIEVGNQDTYGTTGFTGNVAELHSFESDVYTQNITVTSAGTYTLDFLGAARVNTPNPYNDIITTFNGQQFLDTPLSTSATAYSHSFTVGSAGTYALSFSTDGGGSYGGIFSDVSMSKTQAVPEPAPMAALGLGVVGLVIRRRRK